MHREIITSIVSIEPELYSDLISRHHTTLFVSCPDIHIVFLILGIDRFEDELIDPWDISLELSFYLIDEYPLEWSDDISIEFLE